MEIHLSLDFFLLSVGQRHFLQEVPYSTVWHLECPFHWATSEGDVIDQASNLFIFLLLHYEKAFKLKYMLAKNSGCGKLFNELSSVYLYAQ